MTPNPVSSLPLTISRSERRSEERKRTTTFATLCDLSFVTLSLREAQPITLCNIHNLIYSIYVVLVYSLEA